MKHLISLDNWDAIRYKNFFKLVTDFKSKKIYCPTKNLILCNLFYEPSTRTSSSFASAMWRIGGQVISINDVNYSSVSKGENLEDTIIFTSIKNMDIFKNLKTVTFNIKQGPRNQPAINWLKKLTKQSVHHEEKIIIDAEVIKNFNSLKEIDIKVQK